MSSMICRGHIRASKDALQIFLGLMVLCKNWCQNLILYFVFILRFKMVEDGLGGQISYQLSI